MLRAPDPLLAARQLFLALIFRLLLRLMLYVVISRSLFLYFVRIPASSSRAFFARYHEITRHAPHLLLLLLWKLSLISFRLAHCGP